MERSEEAATSERETDPGSRRSDRPRSSSSACLELIRRADESLSKTNLTDTAPLPARSHGIAGAPFLRGRDLRHPRHRNATEETDRERPSWRTGEEGVVTPGPRASFFGFPFVVQARHHAPARGEEAPQRSFSRIRPNLARRTPSCSERRRRHRVLFDRPLATNLRGHHCHIPPLKTRARCPCSPSKARCPDATHRDIDADGMEIPGRRRASPPSTVPASPQCEETGGPLRDGVVADAAWAGGAVGHDYRHRLARWTPWRCVFVGLEFVTEQQRRLRRVWD